MPDPVTAAMERSFDRFAQRIGLASAVRSGENNPQETSVANQNKTASQSQSGPGMGRVVTAGEQGGSQVQTQQDRGDYGTAAQALGDQRTETKGAAPAGTDRHGAQLDTVRFDDQQYTLNGPAALAVRAAVDLALAGRSKEASELLHQAGRGLRLSAMLRRTAVDSDLGTELGGKPDSVMAGEQEAGQDVSGQAVDKLDTEGDASQTPGTGGMPLDSQVMSEIQRKLNELAEEKRIDTEVASQLTEIMKSVGMPAVAVKEKLARMIRRAELSARIAAAGRKRTAQDGRENSSSTVPAVGSPATGTAGTGSASVGAPATPRASAAMPTQARRVQAGPSAETRGGDVVKPSNVPPSTMVDRGESLYDLTDGDPDEQARREANGKTDDGDTAATHNGQELHDAGQYALGSRGRTAGRRTAAVDWSLYDQIGSGTVQAARRPASAARIVRADDRSPSDVQQETRSETNRYTGAEQGDTKPDEISEGTAPVLESPETGSVTDEATRQLDREHAAVTRGNTVASRPVGRPVQAAGGFAPFFGSSAQRAEQCFARFGKAAELIGKRAHEIGQRPTKAKQAAIRAVASVLQDVTNTAVSLKRLMSAQPSKESAQRLLQALSAVEATARRAEDVALVAEAVCQVEHEALQKMSRVRPALDLGARELEYGQIGFNQLGAKVAEYVKCDDRSFDLMAQKVEEVGNVRTASADRPVSQRPMQRTARVVPQVVTDALSGTSSGNGDPLSDPHFFD